MSDLRTAANGAYFDGLIQVKELGPQGMITVRGDFADASFTGVLTEVVGAEMPGQRETRLNGDRGILWMSPDELLVLCTYAEAQELADKLAEALAGQHALVANVSDARAVFTLTGGDIREVIAKVAPVDMSRDQFTTGMIRRTRLAQVAAAFWLEDDNTARIVCFRSVGEYMFNLLKTSATPGSAVGFL